ncbi:MAG: OB-fold-containig protein [Pseudomonadota bacterium]
MSSLSLLLAPELAPFAIALGVVAALCLLELAMMLLGLSLLADGGAEADIDADLGGVDGVEPGLEIEPAAEGLDVDPELEAPGVAAPSALSWLGLGEVPFAIWLAGTLTAFGLSGYGLQLAAIGVFGAAIGPAPAAALALLPGLAIGGRFARTLGRLLPKTETTAISSRSYGGRRGVITMGAARRDIPAEVRFTDGHGNTHYARVEPLEDAEVLEAGTEVAIIRLRDGRLRAIRATD